MHWLVVLLVICIAAFGEAFAETAKDVKQIHTIAADDQRGIPSHVILIHRNKVVEDLGATDQNGVIDIVPPMSCMSGMRLKVTSGSAWYDDATKLMSCENPEYVALERIHIRDRFPQVYEHPEIVNLAHNTVVAAAAQDYALMALLYSELAAEISPFSEELYRQYSSRATSFYALATHYPGVIVQGEVLKGSWLDFAAFVQGRQVLWDIPGDGLLNYLTLSLEADRNVHWFRNRIYREISQVPTLGDVIPCTRFDTSIWDKYVAEKPVVSELLRIAEEQEGIGEYGDATLLYNEVHARAKLSKEVADYAAYAAFFNAGKVLGVEQSVRCDPEQSKYVLTEDMVAAVEKYQRDKGISPTGNLDYRTVRSFSNFGVGDYLSSVTTLQGGTLK